MTQRVNLGTVMGMPPQPNETGWNPGRIAALLGPRQIDAQPAPVASAPAAPAASPMASQPGLMGLTGADINRGLTAASPLLLAMGQNFAAPPNRRDPRAVQMGVQQMQAQAQQAQEMKRREAAGEAIRGQMRNLPPEIRGPVGAYLDAGDIEGAKSLINRALGRTNVQTDVRVSTGEGQSAFEEQLGKDFAKKFDAYTEGAATAQRSLNSYAEMRNILESGDLRTGFLAEQILNAKRVMSSLGFDVGDMSSAEGFMALSNQAALDELGNLSGVASDTDMRVIMNTVPNIADTTEGAKLKIEIAERAAQYRIAVAQAAQEYVSENGYLDSGWTRRLNEMSNQFRQAVLGRVRQSDAFTGYKREDAERRLEQLRGEGLSNAEITRRLREEGYIK